MQLCTLINYCLLCPLYSEQLLCELGLRVVVGGQYLDVNLSFVCEDLECTLFTYSRYRVEQNFASCVAVLLFRLAEHGVNAGQKSQKGTADVSLRGVHARGHPAHLWFPFIGARV